MGRLLALLALVLWVSFSAGCAEKKAPPEPDLAPGFNLPSDSGASVRLSDFKGKVVLLDFWATWCPPCRLSIPHLVELQQTMGPKGFQALGLNLDEGKKELASFLAQSPVNYPILHANDDTRAAYGGVAAIPQMFLVDRKGKLRERYQGFSPEIGSKVRAAVEALLKEDGG